MQATLQRLRNEGSYASRLELAKLLERHREDCSRQALDAVCDHEVRYDTQSESVELAMVTVPLLEGKLGKLTDGHVGSTSTSCCSPRAA